ncbi:hypothetical protein F0U60_26745 [Archangium minus]|uniref:Uncharacterized protein n=1 Tax=Archangium minus TaxID=83450 RepID=A0ABY9WU64_9BACT|nr:hypothetical protein F0U60_26745 [Archangium minus]
MDELLLAGIDGRTRSRKHHELEQLLLGHLARAEDLHASEREDGTGRCGRRGLGRGGGGGWLGLTGGGGARGEKGKTGDEAFHGFPPCSAWRQGSRL